MTPPELRSLSGAHGALAWLSVLALAVAVIAAAAAPWSGGRAGTTAGRRAARVRAWAVPVAAALGVATFVTGLSLHGPFQSKLRQRLFLASETLGWLFERKEHVAFGALVLTLSALFAAWAARALAGRRGVAEGARELEVAATSLGRAVVLALSGALLLSVLALGVSVAVSGRVRF